MSKDFEIPVKQQTRCNILPQLVIDSREQAPLIFKNLPTVSGSLTTGDYSILGCEHLFAVERKSIPDLVGSLCSNERSRFERELHRLRGYYFKRLLIVGSKRDIESGNYRSQANPKSILNSLECFEVRYETPIVFLPTPEDAALQIEKWAFWYSREILKIADYFISAKSMI